jgi:hypothetical protein
MNKEKYLDSNSPIKKEQRKTWGSKTWLNKMLLLVPHFANRILGLQDLG